MLVCITLWALLADARCGWQQATWQGTPAWASDSGDWRAVVSEDRARLIYLGPKNSQTNLLYAPEAPKEYRPRGGHIFWLGPQSEWTGKWGTWPPPDEWEQKPSSLAEVKGEWLYLTMPRPNEKLPQLSRAYAWENGRLLCRVSWAGGQGDYQTIQIIQLPAGAVVQAKRTGKTPPGFVRFDTLGKQGFEATTTGPDTRLLADDAVELSAGTAPAKFGFLPQTLKATVAATLWKWAAERWTAPRSTHPIRDSKPRSTSARRSIPSWKSSNSRPASSRGRERRMRLRSG